MTVLEPVVEFIGQLRPGRTVSLDQVMAGADRPRKPVLRVMDRLVREGKLIEVEDDKDPRGYNDPGPARRNPTWRIIETPMLADLVKKPKKVTVRDRMWRVIRARRRFTRRDLRRLAGVTIGSSEDYTQALAGAGFLRIIGKDGHQQVYMLVKDPGPDRPLIREVKAHAQ